MDVYIVVLKYMEMAKGLCKINVLTHMENTPATQGESSVRIGS
jgi:hypothetical protein